MAIDGEVPYAPCEPHTGGLILRHGGAAEDIGWCPSNPERKTKIKEAEEDSNEQSISTLICLVRANLLSPEEVADDLQSARAK